MSEWNLDREEIFANSTHGWICRGVAAALIVAFCYCWYECKVDKTSESNHAEIVDDTSESDSVEKTVDETPEYSFNGETQADGDL